MSAIGFPPIALNGYPQAQIENLAMRAKISDLERQIASLRNEVQKFRKKAKSETKVTVILARETDVRQLASVLNDLFLDSPGFKAKALPDMKCLILRADAKTTREVTDFLDLVKEWKLWPKQDAP
jgi:hypothetical protein